MSNYLNSCKETSGWNLVWNTVNKNTTVDRSSIKAISTLRIWVERYRQRQHLATLTPHMLDDIGITVEQQIEEATKPFWIE